MQLIVADVPVLSGVMADAREKQRDGSRWPDHDYGVDKLCWP
jgi:hypothetical protein